MLYVASGLMLEILNTKTELQPYFVHRSLKKTSCKQINIALGL